MTIKYPVGNLKKLNVLAYSEGYTLWVYNDTEELVCNMIRTHFWNDDKAFYKLIKHGDSVILNGTSSLLAQFRLDEELEGIYVITTK